MRIEKLDQNTKKNLLEDLLKRSPNSYGKYEERAGEDRRSDPGFQTDIAGG